MIDNLEIERFQPVDGTPQCHHECHNTDLADLAAGIDDSGNTVEPMTPAEENSVRKVWLEYPRFVDRRSPLHAAMACSKCAPCHALALSSDPVRHTPVPLIDPAPLGGPQHQCQPDCRYCQGLDGINR